MSKTSRLFILALFLSNCIFAQDKVIKNNSEEVLGKIILFQNGKFTLQLPDKSELIFPKDGIKEVLFDTTKCHLISVAIIPGKEEDMDPDCASKNLGNCVFINKTGGDLTLRIYKQGSENDYKDYKLSNSEDPVKFYGLESGSYTWITFFGLNTSGGLFIPKCKTATPVIIK